MSTREVYWDSLTLESLEASSRVMMPADRVKQGILDAGMDPGPPKTLRFGAIVSRMGVGTRRGLPYLTDALQVQDPQL
jgi:hypothetical protein